MITICHVSHAMKMGPLPGNLTYGDIVKGRYYHNSSIEDDIEKAMKEYNYLLDLTEKKEDCEVS